MSEPLGPVVIGVREIYDAVVKLTGAVDRLTAQHEDIRSDVTDHEVRLRAVDSAPSRLTDHETRLRVLERARWPLPSLAILVSLAGLVLALVRR